MGLKVYQNGAWQEKGTQVIDKNYYNCANSMMKLESDTIEFIGSSANELQVLNQMIFGRVSFRTIKTLSFNTYPASSYGHKIGVLDPIGQEESIGKLLGLNCTYVTDFLMPVLTNDSGLPIYLTMEQSSHICYLKSKEEIPSGTMFEIKFIGTLAYHAYSKFG